MIYIRVVFSLRIPFALLRYSVYQYRTLRVFCKFKGLAQLFYIVPVYRTEIFHSEGLENYSIDHGVFYRVLGMLHACNDAFAHQRKSGYILLDPGFHVKIFS